MNYNIVFILSSVLLNASAQLFMRKGMLKVGEIGFGFTTLLTAFPSMILNVYLWISLICYAISILLWMVVLSKVQVSFAYPFLSIGYIVAAILGYLLFSENLSLLRISGILVICFGVFLISRS